jgi:AcrR family transcriptional regulator
VERGRPRIFDEEQALDAALQVFWRNGYQAASLAELTAAMGISKPSMYAAFGNKEQLYLQALQRYQQQQLSRHADALAREQDLTAALRSFLRSVADMVVTGPGRPGGCMVVTSAVSCDLTRLPAPIVNALSETVHRSTFELLETRLGKAVAQGQLPDTIDIRQLADYFASLMSGMAVMAKLGADRQRLYGVIEQALLSLPVN